MADRENLRRRACHWLSIYYKALSSQIVLSYDFRTVDAQSAGDHACDMMENNRMKALLVKLAFLYLIAAGPVQAGLMDFTVESLKTEDSSGC